MRFGQIGAYVLRDLQGMRHRVPLGVATGVLTLAAAMVINTLNLAFARQAEALMERAMKQVRTAASTLYVRPHGGQYFTTSQYGALMKRICKLERSRLLVDVSAVVDSVEDDVFQLLNARGNSHGMQDVQIWSAPANAAFLRQQEDIEVGLTYHAGRPFSTEKPDSGCTLAHSLSTGEPKPEFSDTFRPRLGVIMNARYIKRLRNYEVDDDERLKRDLTEGDLPESIRIRFVDTNASGEGQVTEAKLQVTGVIEDSMYYPDLIFTESLAGMYFQQSGTAADCSDILRGPVLTARIAARIDQWETGDALVAAKDNLVVAKDNTKRFIPKVGEEVAYPQFRASGCVPYDRIIVRAEGWREEGVREEVEKKLTLALATLEFDGAEAETLAESATRAATRDASESSRHQALDQLRQALARPVGTLLRGHLPLKTLTAIVSVHDKDGVVFRAEDAVRRPIFELAQAQAGKVSIAFQPAWQVEMPDPDGLVTAVLRQRNLSRTYAWAMTLIVIVLAAFASCQLALGHVVHKTRDLGVLLTNGAGRSAIFAIFLGQIGAMVLVGCVLGALIALGAAPGLEKIAGTLMDRLLAELLEQGDEAVAHVLDLDVATLAAAAAWVTLSAAVGALVPVIHSTRVDPLSSLGKGD